MTEERTQYEPTIGIECHVQLKTRTKLFAAIENDAREAQPNTLISHICVGLPGALPVLNKKAVELAIAAAFALNTEPQKFSKFDRKHYFYPDLPKGYQITQYDQPIIVGGQIDISSDGKTRPIKITRVHLEEDAGKNIHPEGADYSLVDLNRAGTPLLEIVSEPEIKSAAEAKAFARELWLTMKYAGVTDGDLYHGHVRFDVNVSVSDDLAKPGIRTEVKNLNSFRSVEGAVNYEIKRQIELREKGREVVQETRGWDEAKQRTTSQRGKEEAHDYRYFPEPDVPPLQLNDEYINSIRDKLSILPQDIRSRLSELQLDPRVIEDLLDRQEIVGRVLDAVSHSSAENARLIAFQLLDEPGALKIELNEQLKIAEMVSTGKLSSTAGKEVLQEHLKHGADIDETIVSRLQLSDSEALEKIVQAVLTENFQAVEDVKNGETKAIGFLIGQIMKKSQGKANPEVAREILKKKLNS